MQMRCLLTLVFVTSSVCAQSLTETQTLRSLARVWGFLKYNHPAVATGRYDWDNQLIRLIPAVRHAQNRDQLSAIYLGILDTLGPIKRCKSCILMGNIPAGNRRNLDLSILDDSTLLSPELRKKLIYIKDNRNQQANFYVQRIKGVKNTGYEQERLYADMRIPDESYRLLALFRYWNIIQYFFPYKYTLDGDWNDVLTDLIPVFRQATTEQAYQQAIYQLTARIQDSHGFLMTVDQSRCMRCWVGSGCLLPLNSSTTKLS